MPDISEIKISDISCSNCYWSIPKEVKQLIIDEFYLQLKKASELIGNPHFSRNVTIVLTDNDRFFNSENSHIVFEKWCIDWTKKTAVWQLKEAISHEIVHLIVGNAPRRKFINPATAMEEGIAYYNTMRLYDYVNYKDHTHILNATNCIKDALREVPDLLTIWRNSNGEAPVIQMLNDVDLENWGLGVELRNRLLSDFK